VRQPSGARRPLGGQKADSTRTPHEDVPECGLVRQVETGATDLAGRSGKLSTVPPPGYADRECDSDRLLRAIDC
jgi:hypothetical protein